MSEAPTAPPTQEQTAPSTGAPVPAPGIETTRYSISERWHNGQHGAMRYWKSEPAHGIPIVLVHGYGALIEHWQRIMRPIARSHTLAALDLYGLGYSAFPLATPSKELWARQVADFIAAVLQEPAIVVGHSMGGMVAAQVAYAHPEWVRGLVLTNSTGLPINPENDMSPIDRLFFSMVRTPLLGEVLASAYSRPWGVRQGLLESYYRKECVTPELVEAFSGPLRRRGASLFYLAVSRAFAGKFLEFQAGDVTAPTLLLWGTEDRSMPATQAGIFKQRLLPQAEIVFLSESGHCPFDEVPDAFTTALLAWINRTFMAPEASPQ